MLWHAKHNQAMTKLYSCEYAQEAHNQMFKLHLVHCRVASSWGLSSTLVLWQLAYLQHFCSACTTRVVLVWEASPAASPAAEGLPLQGPLSMLQVRREGTAGSNSLVKHQHQQHFMQLSALLLRRMGPEAGQP